MEVGNRLRLEEKLKLLISAGAGDETVPDEVDLDFRNFVADQDM
jgi:hypothetical protein